GCRRAYLLGRVRIRPRRRRRRSLSRWCGDGICPGGGDGGMRVTPTSEPLLWRSRIGAIVDHLERFPLGVLQLLFRVSIAALFWNSGLTKIASWQTTIVLFRDEYKVPLLPPELAATLAATVELSCPVLLVLGLATRLATLPMLAMTV